MRELLRQAQQGPDLSEDSSESDNDGPGPGYYN